jgi:hypothetical protein
MSRSASPRAARALILASIASAALGRGVAADVTLNDCGGFTEFTRIPGVGTFPDTDTLVYQAAYAANGATAAAQFETVIRGKAPKARYWSFAVIDQARREIANLSDFQIALDATGSYEVHVRQGCAGVPNCLDLSGALAPAAPGLVYYRLYVPEGGETGGVGLPTVTYHRSAGANVDIGPFGDSDSCRAALAMLTAPIQPDGAIGENLDSASGLEQPVCSPGSPPAESRGGHPGEAQLETLEKNGVPTAVTDVVRMAGSVAAFGATKANAYESILFSMTSGDLELRAKAPTYRRQHAPLNGWSVDDGSEQVRYWSLCTSQETHPVDCIRDENVIADVSDPTSFTVIVAPKCPVDGYANCLRSGVTSAAGLAGVPFLLYRNTLPRDDFYDDLGPVRCPNESSVFCGPYELKPAYVKRDCP